MQPDHQHTVSQTPLKPSTETATVATEHKVVQQQPVVSNRSASKKVSTLPKAAVIKPIRPRSAQPAQKKQAGLGKMLLQVAAKEIVKDTINLAIQAAI